MSRNEAFNFFELSNDETAAAEARLVIDAALKTLEEGRGISSLYVLAEGGGGVVDLLLKAARVFADKAYYIHAQHIAGAALDQKPKDGIYNIIARGE